MAPFEKSKKIKVQRSAESKRHLHLEVKKLTAISKGRFHGRGGIEEGTAYVRGDAKKRGIPVVIKHYGPDVGNMFPDHMAKLAALHKGMKAAGLKVPATFRFDLKNRLSVMTNLNQNGYVALSDLEESTTVPSHSLENIPNFSELAEAVFAHALIAAEKGYLLTIDSYFLLIDPKGQKNADFIIADFDIVHFVSETQKRTSLAYSRAELPEVNLAKAVKFLEVFCTIWLEPSAVPEYHKVLQTTYTKFRQEHIYGILT